MNTASDAQYAQCLMNMLQSDRDRLKNEPAHVAVVLWMVEELRHAAETLKLEREISKAMLAEAATARSDALTVRRQAKRLKKRRAA